MHRVGGAGGSGPTQACNKRGRERLKAAAAVHRMIGSGGPDLVYAGSIFAYPVATVAAKLGTVRYRITLEGPADCSSLTLDTHP